MFILSLPINTWLNLHTIITELENKKYIFKYLC